MKIELTKEWCMNMAEIEARAAELHEGCRMPMEQARELAASEASPAPGAMLNEWHARGQDWALSDAMSGSLPNDWTTGDIARAYAAGARAGEGVLTATDVGRMVSGMVRKRPSVAIISEWRADLTLVAS
jgi:hypothetical protein